MFRSIAEKLGATTAQTLAPILGDQLLKYRSVLPGGMQDAIVDRALGLLSDSPKTIGPLAGDLGEKVFSLLDTHLRKPKPIERKQVVPAQTNVYRPYQQSMPWQDRNVSSSGWYFRKVGPGTNEENLAPGPEPIRMTETALEALANEPTDELVKALKKQAKKEAKKEVRRIRKVGLDIPPDIKKAAMIKALADEERASAAKERRQAKKAKKRAATPAMDAKEQAAKDAKEAKKQAAKDAKEAKKLVAKQKKAAKKAAKKASA